MPALHPDDRDRFLTLTAGLWSVFRNERIFLTGGTGFVGCWLLESFLWANERFNLGASLTVLTRNPAGFLRKAPELAANPAVTLHAGDICSFDFPPGRFRFCVHAAADPNPAADPLLTLDTITAGTRRALDFSRQSEVQAFLLVSSGAVYGPQPPALSHVAEAYAGAPDSTRLSSVYGQGKRLAEMLCTVYGAQFGLSCKIARCFAFAGPYLPSDGHFAFGNFVRDAVQGNSIHVSGDGAPVRSYLYAMDLAVWLWTILLQGTPGRAYNVGSEHEVTIGQLAAEVSALLSPGLPVRIARPRQGGESPSRYVPSTRLAREELSLREYTDRQQSISRTAAWYRQTLISA